MSEANPLQPPWPHSLRALLQAAPEGSWLWVESARDDALREVFLALSAQGHEPLVLLGATELAQAPVGATALYLPTLTDAAWLTERHASLRERRLRLVVWPSEATASSLRQKAPLFCQGVQRVIARDDSPLNEDLSTLLEPAALAYFHRRFRSFLAPEQQQIPFAMAAEMLRQILLQCVTLGVCDPALLDPQRLARLTILSGLTRMRVGFAVYLLSLLYVQKEYPFDPDSPLTFDELEASARDDALPSLAKRYYALLQGTAQFWERENLLGRLLTATLSEASSPPLLAASAVRQSTGLHDPTLISQLQEAGILSLDGDFTPLVEWLPMAEEIVAGRTEALVLPEAPEALYSLLLQAARLPSTAKQALTTLEWAVDMLTLEQALFVGFHLMVSMRARSLQGELAIAIQKSPKMRKMLVEYQQRLGLSGGASGR